MSLSLAKTATRWLKDLGVRQVVICAGARNAPFIKEVSEQLGFKVFRFFEEREAGFFAVGLSRRGLDGAYISEPVAVITTSGTAAAELLPACIEAFYQRLPLIWVTADRPRSYRGSGAPQSIEQVGLFSSYVEASLDWTLDQQPPLEFYSFQAPIHLNICFDEPLLVEGVTRSHLQPPSLVVQKEDEGLRLSKGIEVAQSSMQKPLFLLGPMTASEQQTVKQSLPVHLSVYAEALSGLKSCYRSLAGLSESSIRKKLQNGLWDGVIRIGDVPTHRLWRDLEQVQIPVIHFTNKLWRGLSSSVHPMFQIEQLRALNFAAFRNPLEQGECEKRAQSNFLKIEQYPLSEIGWIRNLSQSLQADDLVYLGNSLPVREFEWAHAKTQKMFGNRGANGIDGQISTFLGMAQRKGRNFGFFGDLTTLYGLASLWALPQLDVDHFQVIVINNFGGQIFQSIFNDSRFLNAHSFQFSHWAKMWGVPYQQPKRLEDWNPDLPRSIVEIQPDLNQTQKLMQELEE